MRLSHGTWFLPGPMLIRLSANQVVKTNNEICSDKTKGSVPFIVVRADRARIFAHPEGRRQAQRANRASGPRPASGGLDPVRRHCRRLHHLLLAKERRSVGLCGQSAETFGQERVSHHPAHGRSSGPAFFVNVQYHSDYLPKRSGARIRGHVSIRCTNKTMAPTGSKIRPDPVI